MLAQEKAAELKAVQRKFFADLDALAAAANGFDGQNAALRFCRSAYEFGRLRRLMPEQVLTAAEEARLCEKFEPGIIEFALQLQGISSSLFARNLYTAKWILSILEFIRTDFLQLYEKGTDMERATDLQKALDTLKDRQYYLDSRIDDWQYDTEYDHPNELEKRCLEGIPRGHGRWKEELGMTSSDETVQDDSDSGSDWTK